MGEMGERESGSEWSLGAAPAIELQDETRGFFGSTGVRIVWYCKVTGRTGQVTRGTSYCPVLYSTLQYDGNFGRLEFVYGTQCKVRVP